jgi:hypothetical protein
MASGRKRKPGANNRRSIAVSRRRDLVCFGCQLLAGQHPHCHRFSTRFGFFNQGKLKLEPLQVQKPQISAKGVKIAKVFGIAVLRLYRSS